MQTKIDQYFANKGIKTIFNCLGNNERLIRAYVSNFRNDADNHYLHNSQHTKIGTYNKLWTLQPRHKMTGFELLDKQDTKFRNFINKFIVEPQHSPMFLINNDEHEVSLSYKQELINFVKTIENPLVYLSGGVDSELVASAMIEAGVKFNVVIFEWTNNGNHIINGSEIFHAYRFCKKHGIIPTIRQINIEKLWASDYFKRLAIDIQIQSPHLVTYAHAIKSMSLDYPTATHVFGGEVKFKTDYLLDDGNNSNLVFLDKLVPGYDGKTYTDSFVGNSSEIANLRLVYAGSTGAWFVDSYHVGPFLESGNWTDTPAVQYEFRIATISGFGDGSYASSPSSTTGWTTIFQGFAAFTQICNLTAGTPGYGATNYATFTYGIEVRVVGETTPVQSSSITFQVVTSYI